MATVAGGIARGLETGIRLGQSFQDRARQDEDRARARQIQDKQLATQEEDRLLRIADQNRTRELQDDDAALKALDDEGKALTSEFEGLVSQYGGFDGVPEDVRGQLTQRQRDLFGRRRVLNEKRMRPILEREKKSASELMDGIRRGSVNLNDVPDDQFYRAIGVVTKRDPAQLLRQDGASPLGTAVQRLLEQLETPTSPEELANAANIILEPELSKGVGEPGRDGSTIVKKEIARFVPAPGNSGRLLPVLKVTVKRQDGAMGSYFAPVTEGRSSDGDDDRVVQMDLSSAMDYVGRLATLEEVLNQPEVRAKIERGAQGGRAGLDEFRQAYSAVGGKPYKRKTKTDTVDVGDKKLRITMDEDSGKELSREELTVGINPNRQLAADTSLAVADTRADASRDNARTRAAATTAAAERRGVGTKPMTEQERKQAGINAENQKAKSMGLTFDQTRKTWVKPDGKKASAEDLAAIAKAGADALKRTGTQTRDGQANPPTRIKYDAQGNRVS